MARPAKPPAKISASRKTKPAVANPAQERSKNTAALVPETKKISAAATARAEDLLAEISRRKQRIAEDFYDIGLALLEIQKKKLHAALGYVSFAALLQERNVLGLSQAHKLIRLVTTVPREQALAIGQEKAIALVDYARATPDLDTPGTLVAGGALPRGKRIAEASVRELQAATSALRKKAGKARAASPERVAAGREAAAMQTWLRKRGAKKATATIVKKDGALWIRMELPVESAVRTRG